MNRLAPLLAAARRPHRARLAVAALLALIAAAASVTLLGPSGWFITAAALAGLAGLASAAAFNALLPSAAIRLLAILRTACRYGERVVGHNAALGTMARLRPALFSALAQSPPAHALSLSVGDTTSRLVQDVAALETGLVQRSIYWAALSAALCALALVALAGPAPTASLILILTLALLLARARAARLAALGQAIPPAQGALRQEAARLLAASQELRAYGLQDWAADRLMQRSGPLLAAQTRHTAQAGSLDMLRAATAGAAAIAALLLASPAGAPMAALAALAAGAGLEALGPLYRLWHFNPQRHAATARLNALLTTPAPITSPIGKAAHPSTLRLSPHTESFAPGAIIGLTGPSGCGKTTLLETLVALLPTQPGQILIGGQDLAPLPPAQARQNFALAPQEARLLCGTIRENLLLANSAAPEPELWEALHDAALADRIRTLPQGLETWLGEGGITLSGGERRRLALARAYLSPAPWLLLDEPTEGLDAETERRVVTRLQARLHHHTQGALIITHRAAPLKICTHRYRFLRAGTAPVGQIHAKQQHPSDRLGEVP